MIRRASVALGLFSLLTLAACGGGSASTAAPSTAASAPAESTAVEAPCAPSSAAGTVAVSIKDLAFNPAAVSAKVGDVIAFTNEDSANHTATLDEGDCGTETLANGASEGLTFTAAGTYPFHCAIHSSMTGTITITE
jgi:plastocyanin